MKLSNAQQEALDRLTAEPQSAYKLRCSLPTLRALVRMGLARDVTRRGSGGMFSPRNHFEFVKVAP